MKSPLMLIAALLCCSLTLLSQSNKADKKMESVYKLVDKQKYDDASKALEELLADYPDYGKGWDFLMRLRYKEYTDAQSMDGIFSQLKVTTTVKDENGKEKEGSDSLTKAVLGMLTEISPSKRAYSKYLYTMRKAMACANDAYLCSAKWRALFVDAEVDTAIGKKAMKYYQNAEKEFEKKNYDDAAKQYKRALDEQPDFYKAGLYLGDCLYFTGNYQAAGEAFKQASSRFPTLLEPGKYLIDAYAKQKLYDKCLTEGIACMAVYPDLSIAVKMDDAAYFLGQKFDFAWTARPVLPNTIADSSVNNINVYKPEHEAKADKSWLFYQKSLEKIKPYCDPKGIIIQPNKLTESRYMEVYGWEEMLRNSDDASLEEARRMQKDGYLDCYVLVSCFHPDFYEQYKDFAARQKNKITAYYSKYLVKK